MKTLILSVMSLFLILGCQSKHEQMKKVIFLHHSTGQRIWIGKTNRVVHKLTGRGDVYRHFKAGARIRKLDYLIEERSFPADTPYGWKNYPFDYYNIWVKNAGEQPFMNEPTLEILTREYDIIIFKHCFPVSKILEDTGAPDVNSDEKRIENYKLQYNALKNKMHEFQDNKFIIWTPSVHLKGNITPEEAKRTQEFYRWMADEWDEKGDNIFIWDFYNYETEGSMYLKENYATGPTDSHPNIELSSRLAPLFANFIIDVIEDNIK